MNSNFRFKHISYNVIIINGDKYESYLSEEFNVAAVTNKNVIDFIKERIDTFDIILNFKYICDKYNFLDIKSLLKTILKN